MLTRFIGDVHGKFDRYKKVIFGVSRSIQVGDMGVGFRRFEPDMAGHGMFYSNPPYSKMKLGDHRFIRGNHDNPGECAKQEFWIPDGSVERGVMFVGGALSIDRAYREENFNWWPGEELSSSELNALVDAFTIVRPRVMVTHDCPESVARVIMNTDKVRYPSRTRQAFQSMLEICNPNLWIFGHWHQSLDQTIGGTRFICLNELEWKDIDLDGYRTEEDEKERPGPD